MEFIQDIIEFLFQALILVGVFLLGFAGVISIGQRRKGSEEGFVEATLLNDRYELNSEAVLAAVESDQAIKSRVKKKKRIERIKLCKFSSLSLIQK